MARATKEKDAACILPIEKTSKEEGKASNLLKHVRKASGQLRKLAVVRGPLLLSVFRAKLNYGTDSNWECSDQLVVVVLIILTSSEYGSWILITEVKST